MFLKLINLGKDALNAIKTKAEYRVFSQIRHSNLEEKIVQNSIEKKEKLKICFVLPDIYPYKGGITSVLRLGTYLTTMGHRVFYSTYTQQALKTMKKNALKNLPYFKGEVIDRDRLLKESFDIGIATYWLSAYFIQNNQHIFKEKYYFVQDFEPAFYPLGDLYYLALNTYKLGFKIISLGNWNCKQIENATGVQCNFIEFPFESNQYEIKKRTITIKDTIKIAVYLKTVPKRAPILLFHSLKLLKENMEREGIKIEVFFFGLERFVNPPTGKNIGKLSTSGLRKLYSQCHIGIVNSFTNISLVPYEMIASGLPVFEARDGSAPFYFSESEMVFLNSSPNSLTTKVRYYLNHQDELNKILENAQKKIQSKTWENSAKQFNKILLTT